MVGHLLQRLVGAVGVLDGYNLDFVELVQAVEAAHVFAVGTGFTTEAGGVGAVLQREVALLENHVTVDVGDGHLGGGDEVEVIDLAVVHLSLFVRQLAGAVGGILVHHIGRLDFHETGGCGLVEEEVDEGALQTGAFAFIDGEAGAGDLGAELEVDDVVFLHEFPVRECALRQVGGVALRIDDFVVFGAFAGFHGGVGQVGQQHHLALQQFLLLLQFGTVGALALLQSGHFGFEGFGLVTLAFLEELPDLFRALVLRHQVVVDSFLQVAVLAIQFANLGHQIRGIEILDFQSVNNLLGIFS